MNDKDDNSTQSGKKMLNYFEHLKTTQEFKDRIFNLKDVVSSDKYWDDISEFCEYFNLLPTSDWSITIDQIIRYDHSDVFQPFGTPDMCAVTSFDEIEDEEKFYKGKDPYLFKKAFPVLLAISPYASRQDIIDFIERTYSKRISPELDKNKDEKIQIDKIKKKRKSKRDDFIFEHRHLPYSKIDEMQKEEFKTRLLGYDYIGKIIRKEKKRRGIED